MTYFNIGDKVQVTTKTCLGGVNEIPDGLKEGVVYTISDIDRSLDGAYDWDDLYLEGVQGMFCEFDFKEYL